MVAYVRCAQVASTSQVEAPQSVRTVQQTRSRPQAARLSPPACGTRGRAVPTVVRVRRAWLTRTFQILPLPEILLVVGFVHAHQQLPIIP